MQLLVSALPYEPVFGQTISSVMMHQHVLLSPSLCIEALVLTVHAMI